MRQGPMTTPLQRPLSKRRLQLGLHHRTQAGPLVARPPGPRPDKLPSLFVVNQPELSPVRLSSLLSFPLAGSWHRLLLPR